MSKQSSLKLSRTLSMLDWSKHGQCLHVSLTYHRVWPETKEHLGREKAEIAMHVGRHAKCGIWRLEYQKRQVPHFHLLVWLGHRSAEEFCGWVDRWWRKYSGNDSEFACKVTSGDQVRGVWYLAMHAGKREQAPAFAVGRWWGYIRRDVLLEAADIHSHGEVSERERVWWARIYRRSTGCKTRNAQGLSWFLPRAWQCGVASWIQSQMESERSARGRGKNPF